MPQSHSEGVKTRQFLRILEALGRIEADIDVETVAKAWQQRKRIRNSRLTRQGLVLRFFAFTVREKMFPEDLYQMTKRNMLLVGMQCDRPAQQ